jgi:adenosylcobinamide kinase/adenosylcobinamide-phosphate guanylyltransferase
MRERDDTNLLVFITGGVRSGKSRFALERATAAAGQVLFVATALANDDELRARITKHRAERPAGWRTAEATEGDLAGHIDGDEPCLVLDCLALYVGRRLTEGTKPGRIIEEVESASRRMLDRFDLSIVVSNEVGSGIIPDNAMAREYSEVLGKANQVVAALADEVVLMVSGIPVKVK